MLLPGLVGFSEVPVPLKIRLKGDPLLAVLMMVSEGGIGNVLVLEAAVDDELKEVEIGVGEGDGDCCDED